MICYIRGHDLWRHPETAQKMFRDRTHQFSDRHGWDLSVDEHGYEVDSYDREDPVYIISRSHLNPHQGSMRLMPLVGRTMISEHFIDTVPRHLRFRHDIWECTRFCVSSGEPKNIAHQLFAAGSVFMSFFEIGSMIALFDSPMQRVYRSIGLSPKIVGSHVYGQHRYFAGIWDYEKEQNRYLLDRAGLKVSELETALSRSGRDRLGLKVAA